MSITNHGTFSIYQPVIPPLPIKPVAPLPPVANIDPLPPEATADQIRARLQLIAAHDAAAQAYDAAKAQYDNSMEAWREAAAIITHWQSLADVNAIFARRADGADWHETTKALPDDRNYCLTLDGNVISVASDSQMFGIYEGMTLLETTDPAVAIGWTWTGSVLHPPAIDMRAAVNAERNRRQEAGFTISGVLYQTSRGSVIAITMLFTQAQAAIAADKQPGDLRWLNADRDFTFISANNTRIPMDAQTTLATCAMLLDYVSDLTDSARVLKDKSPTPEDYRDAKHWPVETA